MKKNDYFLDVSGWQSPDLTPYIEASGTSNTIIKVTEATYFVNQYAQSQAETSNPVGYYHFARFGGISSKPKQKPSGFSIIFQVRKYLTLYLIMRKTLHQI